MQRPAQSHPLGQWQNQGRTLSLLHPGLFLLHSSTRDPSESQRSRSKLDASLQIPGDETSSWEMGGILLSANSFQGSLAQGQMQRACGQWETCSCMSMLVPKGKNIPLVFSGRALKSAWNVIKKHSLKTSLSNLRPRTPLQGLHPQTHQLTTSSRPGDTLRSHIPYSPFPSSNSRKAPCQAPPRAHWLAGGECTKMERGQGWAETVQWGLHESKWKDVIPRGLWSSLLLWPPPQANQPHPARAPPPGSLLWYKRYNRTPLNFRPNWAVTIQCLPLPHSWGPWPHLEGLPCPKHRANVHQRQPQLLTFWWQTSPLPLCQAAFACSLPQQSKSARGLKKKKKKSFHSLSSLGSWVAVKAEVFYQKGPDPICPMIGRAEHCSSSSQGSTP